MPARRAHEPPRRVGLQPSLVLPPVPDAVLRAEHPPPAFVVEHRQVAHRDAKRAWLKIADTPLLDEELESDLSVSERVNRHAESMPGRLG